MTAPADAPAIEAKAADAPAAGTETIETEPKAGTRERGPDGKFLKKDGEEPEPKAAEKPEAKAKDDKTEPKEGEEPKADDKTAEPKAAADSKEPPANWSASDKAMFKLQPPEAQAFLLRRYKDMVPDSPRRVKPLLAFRRNSARLTRCSSRILRR